MVEENNYTCTCNIFFFLLKHERKYKFEDVEILHDLMSEQQEHSPELQFRGEGLMNCGYNCLCMPVATGFDCPSYERIGMLTYNIHEVQFGFKKLNNTCRTVS